MWHASTGLQSSLAIGFGDAHHYPREMAPFFALREPTDSAYADLATELPPGTEARLFRPAEETLTSNSPSILTANDHRAMLDLVDQSKPGPFGARTAELGTYLGEYEDGQLLAMAGQRMRLPGFIELSAICVHPTARGRGYGALLTRRLMDDALNAGQRPFLHVRPENVAAVGL